MSDIKKAPPSEPRPRFWLPFGNLSQMVSALAATLALAFVAYQITQIEVNGRKANARQVYLSYSNASLRYPQYIRPDYAAIKADPLKFQQYKWYVSQMLFAYDEILSSVGDPSWLSSFEYELPPHIPLLCDLKRTDAAFFTQYEDNTNALIDTALKGKCPETAP